MSVLRPDVIVEQTNGNLGRSSATGDSISALIVTGVAVANQFALGDVLGPFKSPEDAEALGIDAAYDQTNKMLAYKHISDFYEAAGKGTDLYVMVVADTVKMSDLVDKTQNYAAKLLSLEKGKVKQIAVARIPDAASYAAPVYDGQFHDDIIAAIPKAQALYDYEFEAPRHRPVQILLEGYDFQGNASLSKNLRDLGGNYNRVSVVALADNDVSQTVIGASDKPYEKYAAVGYVLGLVAANPVQRNIGRVKNGKIAITNAGLSNGAAMDTFTETNLNALHENGYIFAWEHSQKAGYFINDDHVCTPIEDDYAYIHRGRPADKVSRLIRVVYLEELLDDIEIDPTSGKLPVSVVKSFESSLETVVNRQMTSQGELSGFDAYVNPDQNVLSTDKLEVEANIVPKGMARIIKVTQSYINPLLNQ